MRKTRQLLLPTVTVGNKEKKQVTQLNKVLYDKAISIMTAQYNQGHLPMGKQGISALIDWLEDNYEMVPYEQKTEESPTETS